MNAGEVLAAVLDAPTPEAAIASLARRGAAQAETFAWQDVWADFHARSFTVAKSAGFDILSDIRKALDKALKEGRTLRDFAGELVEVLKDKGWWGRRPVRDPLTGETRLTELGSFRRLKIIYDVNLRAARAEGAWASFEANKARRPYLRYVAILDQRTRPEHAARHNVTLPVDHPWWDVWAPPCGWNCRCSLQSLSERDVERLRREGEALIMTPPADRLKAWTNKRTGETIRLPEGIDPGWGHNPGKTGWTARLEAELLEKRAAGFDAL